MEIIVNDTLSNPNPILFSKEERIFIERRTPGEDFVGKLQPCDIYDFIRNIKDPEHPYTLEQLKVVDDDSVDITFDDGNTCCIEIRFTPTVPHCNLASTIGLCIYEKLHKELPRVLKLRIFVTPGKHSTEQEINKQVNDKERVIAALENPPLRELVEECIKENTF